MNCIISIFGKEIAENFIPMLIHCDGSQRGILDRLNDKDEESIFWLVYISLY